MSEYPNNNDYIERTGYRPIIMVGGFPPPINGMVAVNEAVREQIVRAGVMPTVIDVAAKSLERSFAVRARRLLKVARGFGRILFSGDLQGATLYMSISGGFGQAYEIFFLVLARLRRMRLYLHYHSYAYLDRSSWLTRVLTAAAGPDSVHITLSAGMAALLQSRYPSVCRVLPISNAEFFPGRRSSSIAVRTSLKTIGFISNISEEKGIFVFLDLVAAYEMEGLSIKAIIAGPCQDEETENKLRRRISNLSTVEYIGPQYDDDKESFFEKIDVLIFPTQYANEAEPLTIHEAMQFAVPVIAYGRGCIPEIISSECGLVIDPALPFTPTALATIKRWLDAPDVYRTASYLAAERFAIALVACNRRWAELLREILGGAAPDYPISTLEE